jgi:glycosyltransferase involved in cell wall biosynthesis
MKEKLLIVTHHLTVGGVQKTLIPALTVIDYDKYDVTLYLRKNRTDLLPLIDKRVKVIINNDGHHYYRKPDCLWLEFLLRVCRLVKNEKKAKYLQNKLNDRIRWYGMEYEHKTYFANAVYDKAIAYVHGYAAQFVSKYVNANRKYMFFHCSTDELREVHKKIIIDFDKVVALHDTQKELIQSWYPEIADRIVLVENYVDGQTIYMQAKEKEVEKPQEKLLLCTCGRMTPVKGFDLAVKAAKILKEKGMDCKNELYYNKTIG